MASDFILFDGKNLSDLFRDIYNNQTSKKKNISALIEELRKLIKTAGDAAIIAPIVKDLIEVSVKNDDHLVKLATIAHRLQLSINKGIGEDGYLSASEKKQLLAEIESSIDAVAEKADDIQDEIDDIVSQIKK